MCYQYLLPPNFLKAPTEARLTTAKQVFAAKASEWAAIPLMAASLLNVALIRGQSSQFPVGDACQLTQTVQACQSLAKSFKYSTALFVAVATSDEKPIAGVAHGQTTQSAAEQTALANCKAAGATDCKIEQSMQNACKAIAVSISSTSEGTATVRGFSAAENRDAAAAQAVEECKKLFPQAGQGCIVYTAPCATDNPAYPSRLPQPAGGQPGSVDPNLVGTWEIDIGDPNTGRWLWQVTANGTYELHSEAFDGTPTNAGTLSAKDGHYSLHAINISWDDSGTYSFQPPGTLVATGKLGTGTWHKIAQDDE
jgi:hypothetical protein